MACESKVAERIRTYRERLNMSAADLAAKSGVAESVVLAIENGEVMPALGVLTKISRALGQRLGTFMDDQFKPDPIITRAPAESEADETLNELGYVSHSLALGKPDRHMDPFRITFAAGVPAGGELSSHEGEELIICISGEVELTYGGETHLLKPGDSAYYNSVVKHGLKARGGAAASVYGVVFMPF